jgi:Fe-S cluster biogenesis protein NfuA
VELLNVADGRVRLRLVGNCDGRPSSAMTMRQTIEEAILARAPDVAGIEVEEPAGFPPVELNGHARVALPVV